MVAKSSIELEPPHYQHRIYNSTNWSGINEYSCAISRKINTQNMVGYSNNAHYIGSKGAQGWLDYS